MLSRQWFVHIELPSGEEEGMFFTLPDDITMEELCVKLEDCGYKIRWLRDYGPASTDQH